MKLCAVDKALLKGEPLIAVPPARAPRNAGEKNAASKLSEEAVRYIRSSDMGTVALARKYKVHPQTIWMCRTGKTWADVV